MIIRTQETHPLPDGMEWVEHDGAPAVVRSRTRVNGMAIGGQWIGWTFNADLRKDDTDERFGKKGQSACRLHANKHTANDTDGGLFITTVCNTREEAVDVMYQQILMGMWQTRNQLKKTHPLPDDMEWTKLNDMPAIREKTWWRGWLFNIGPTPALKYGARVGQIMAVTEPYQNIEGRVCIPCDSEEDALNVIYQRILLGA